MIPLQPKDHYNLISMKRRNEAANLWKVRDMMDKMMTVLMEEWMCVCMCARTKLKFKETKKFKTLFRPFYFVFIINTLFIKEELKKTHTHKKK